MTVAAPPSLWNASTKEPDILDQPDGDTTTELAIVGGGFTGLSAALHAAEAGMACHVLEAQAIGYGGSGRNVGLVNAGLWLPPQVCRAKLGDTIGSRLVHLLGNAPDMVFDLIQRHQMQCEATRAGTIHAARTSGGMTDLRARADEWQRLGAPVQLLSRDEAAERIGTQALHGGLYDARAGTINPVGYVRGLARAARSAGAVIRTGTPVQNLRRDGGLWRLQTSTGTLHARHVLLCTNGYSDGLWPELQRCFTPIHYFQLTTAPMGSQAAHILPNGEGMWDTGTIMFSLRRDVEGRICVGSMGSVIGGAEGLSHRWATRQIRRLFPELGKVRFETAWHGRIAMTPDHLPRIYQLAENLYAPIGYNGRGIGPGTVFGAGLAAALTGGGPDALPVPPTSLQKVPLRKLKQAALEVAFTANQLFRSL
ncbi:NAD(P)/FAD-dependent oxidoreductase [Roseovarius pelagicus]|uniref:FAD-binding oxidoreductase n=1 Tax=Roseovarius pelagicus TaxID=2980108 RepID=A0ABY6DAX0_9RHOB|nr:FAD-binding oxidoreductase [Roseovarius pelagicus]UXX83307.1 FAD-binding oxidoreductase [Roseovarius pelagicus]